MIKRITCIVLAALIGIGAGACGDSAKKEKAVNVLDMNNVTDYQEQDLGKEMVLENAGMKISLDSGNRLVLT